MEVVNELMPRGVGQLAKLVLPGPKGPVFMVNLLKFRDKAEYEDGRATNLTGREAYMIYGRAVAELLPKFGGRAIFVGDVTFLALGKVEELWDEVAIAAYPSRADMRRMGLSREWREIAVHRTAGLKGQLNIETVVPDTAEGSPWLTGFIRDMQAGT